MNISKILLTTLFVLFISACTSKPEKPKHYFTTHISADGIKKFALTVEQGERNKSKVGKRGKGDKNDGKGRRNKSSDRSQGDGQNRMTDLLDRELDRARFCSLGYEIIDSYQREGRRIITGQCNDRAIADPAS